MNARTMLTVTFHATTEIDDCQLKFAVIAAKHENKWIFSRHKHRCTWEIPGGHRESGESIDETAHRELWEETGAVDTVLQRVCVYNVEQNDIPSYGMLYYAKVFSLVALPEGSEIAEVGFFDALPENLTYPAIQPYLHHYVEQWLK